MMQNVLRMQNDTLRIRLRIACSPLSAYVSAMAMRLTMEVRTPRLTTTPAEIAMMPSPPIWIRNNSTIWPVRLS